MKTIALLSAWLVALVTAHAFAQAPVDAFISQAPVAILEKTEIIGMSELECTPFNLEKGGLAMDGVVFAEQWFSNCYSVGAGNLLNAWLMNKTNVRDSHTRASWKRPADREASKAILVSPQHLGVAYAVKRKGESFPTGRNMDWTRLLNKQNVSFQNEFIELLKNTQRDEAMKKRMNEIISKRFYYFEDGGGSAPDAIQNLRHFKVCPVARVEVPLKTEKRGLEFFNRVRTTYQTFFHHFDPKLGTVVEDHILFAQQSLNEIMRDLNLPADSRITLEETRAALLPGPALQSIDPSVYLHRVMLSLCSKSMTHPPVSLSEIFSGSYANHFPASSPIYSSTGPIRNRELLKLYFQPITEGKKDQLPFAISFAGHAIWEGQSHLAWKWNVSKGLWEQDTRYGGHQAVVVGRKWNKESALCEYQIRNSFSTETAPGWRMDPNNFGIWIRDDFLYRSINWGYYLKAQK